MELLAGGELFEQIIKRQRFSERDAARIVGEMASAIAYCHSQGIVHADIKPDNFVFASKDPGSPIKLIDFGLSRVTRVGKNQT
jgi:serine/threonine protein kinase